MVALGIGLVAGIVVPLGSTLWTVVEFVVVHRLHERLMILKVFLLFLLGALNM